MAARGRVREERKIQRRKEGRREGGKEVDHNVLNELTREGGKGRMNVSKEGRD